MQVSYRFTMQVILMVTLQVILLVTEQMILMVSPCRLNLRIYRSNLSRTAKTDRTEGP